MTHQNELLQAIPQAHHAELRSVAEEVPILRDTMPHNPQTHVVFPLSGMVSLVVEYQDGTAHEVGCVGNEGMTSVFGLASVYQPEVSCFGQIAGRGIALPIAKLREWSNSDPQFGAVLDEYAARRYYEACLTAACNSHHNVSQRLAKWMLTAADRVQSTRIPLTHDYLAMMLGTRRATVTLAAQRFAESGWITYHRGNIEIRDPEALQGSACECYTLNPFANAQTRSSAAA